MHNFALIMDTKEEYTHILAQLLMWRLHGWTCCPDSYFAAQMNCSALTSEEWTLEIESMLSGKLTLLSLYSCVLLVLLIQQCYWSCTHLTEDERAEQVST